MKNGKINFTVLAVCLTVGIIFLFLSEYSENKESGNTSEFDQKAYAEQLECDLADMIEAMQGAGKAEVMITLNSGERYHYVAPSSSLFSTTSSDQAAISAVETPQIKGVSVVCTGAGDDAIRLKITKLVASTLNLSEHQIYVTQ